MEPNNLEKDFREKLNQRTIEPSDKAWDRLDAMLSVAEEKKPKKKNKDGCISQQVLSDFYWLETFFFNQKKNTVETPVNTVVIKENGKKYSVEKPILNTIDSTKTEIAISEQTSIQEFK